MPISTYDGKWHSYTGAGTQTGFRAKRCCYRFCCFAATGFAGCGVMRITNYKVDGVSQSDFTVPFSLGGADEQYYELSWTNMPFGILYSYTDYLGAPQTALVNGGWMRDWPSSYGGNSWACAIAGFGSGTNVTISPGWYPAANSTLTPITYEVGDLLPHNFGGPSWGYQGIGYLEAYAAVCGTLKCDSCHTVCLETTLPAHIYPLLADVGTNGATFTVPGGVPVLSVTGVGFASSGAYGAVTTAAYQLTEVAVPGGSPAWVEPTYTAHVEYSLPFDNNDGTGFSTSHTIAYDVEIAKGLCPWELATYGETPCFIDGGPGAILGPPTVTINITGTCTYAGSSRTYTGLFQLRWNFDTRSWVCGSSSGIETPISGISGFGVTGLIGTQLKSSASVSCAGILTANLDKIDPATAAVSNLIHISYDLNTATLNSINAWNVSGTVAITGACAPSTASVTASAPAYDPADPRYPANYTELNEAGPTWPPEYGTTLPDGSTVVAGIAGLIVDNTILRIGPAGPSSLNQPFLIVGNLVRVGLTSIYNTVDSLNNSFQLRPIVGIGSPTYTVKAIVDMSTYEVTLSFWLNSNPTHPITLATNWPLEEIHPDPTAPKGQAWILEYADPPEITAPGPVLTGSKFKIGRFSIKITLPIDHFVAHDPVTGAPELPYGPPS